MTFLKRERARAGAIGKAWLFPNATNPAQPASREYFVKSLWPKLREAAEIPTGKHYGWHSFRRAFANALRGVPLPELKHLGGWKSERTLVNVYMQPDEQAQRTALTHLTANG